jgi:hypothetical protein
LLFFYFVHLFLFLSLSFSFFLGGLLFRGADQRYKIVPDKKGCLLRQKCTKTKTDLRAYPLAGLSPSPPNNAFSELSHRRTF